MTNFREWLEKKESEVKLEESLIYSAKDKSPIDLLDILLNL